MLKLKNTDYWFTSSVKDKKGIHKRYTQGSAINKSIKSYLGKIGLGERANRVTNHSFRHIFITRIGKEKDKYAAQLRVGHKSIRTTERYFHHTIDEYMKKQYNACSIEGDNSINDKQNEGLINA